MRASTTFRSLWLASHAHEVDAVAVARAIGQIVAEVGAVHGDALAIGQHTDVLQASNSGCEQAIAQGVRRRRGRRGFGSLWLRTSQLTSESRKLGQPCTLDSFTNSSGAVARTPEQRLASVAVVEGDFARSSRLLLQKVCGTLTKATVCQNEIQTCAPQQTVATMDTRIQARAAQSGAG